MVSLEIGPSHSRTLRGECPFFRHKKCRRQKEKCQVAGSHGVSGAALDVLAGHEQLA